MQLGVDVSGRTSFRFNEARGFDEKTRSNILASFLEEKTWRRE